MNGIKMEINKWIKNWIIFDLWKAYQNVQKNRFFASRKKRFSKKWIEKSVTNQTKRKKPITKCTKLKYTNCLCIHYTYGSTMPSSLHIGKLEKYAAYLLFYFCRLKLISMQCYRDIVNLVCICECKHKKGVKYQNKGESVFVSCGERPAIFWIFLFCISGIFVQLLSEHIQNAFMYVVWYASISKTISSFLMRFLYL